MADQQQQQKGGDKEKIEKRYVSSKQKLIAMAGGVEKLKPAKVAGIDIAQLAEELFAQEIKEAKTKFMADLKDLLKANMELDKTVADLTREFEKKITEKKKEFADKTDKLIKEVTGFDTMFASFQANLASGAAGQAALPAPEDEENTENDSDSNA